MYKLDLEKAKEPRSNCQHVLDHRKSKRIPKNIYFCFIDYTKAFDCVNHNKLWKILQEIPDHLTYPLRNLYAGHEATVRTRHGKTGCFQIGKGVHQGCILSPCLTSMQGILCKIPGWMNHKLESRLPEEKSITSGMQMTPPLWQKAKSN